MLQDLRNQNLEQSGEHEEISFPKLGTGFVPALFGNQSQNLQPRLASSRCSINKF